jgi:hypothetical protein
MEEEIKDAELENILNQVNRNLSDKPWKHRMAEIISKSKNSSAVEVVSLGHFYTENGKKFVEFYGEYKEKARSMKELQPLINYLDREGYQWI